MQFQKESAMRNVVLTCVLVLTATVNCFGQLQNMVTDVADVNGMLKSAKKVAVFIELGTSAADPNALYLPSFARAKQQVTEKLAKARLEAVANPADADIVIVVHEINEGGQSGVICLGDKLDVFKGGKVPSESDTPIFSVNEYCGISWPLNRAMDKLIKAMKGK
jgi:hypothetical protein